MPARVSTDGLEATWGGNWQAEGTYAFDRSAERAEVFSIDTPPPTVSGSLHVGHVFSYTHTDAVARCATWLAARPISRRPRACGT